MRKVIVNSTPLIALCHINQLELFKKIYGEITIPDAVYKEITAKPDSICCKQVRNALEWIKVEKIENELAKRFYKTQLHEGEVEVMILAKERGADLVVIDDKNAKKHAKYLDLTVTGSLGILLKAKKMELIKEIAPLLSEIQNQGIFLGEKIIKLCLKQAGEL